MCISLHCKSLKLPYQIFKVGWFVSFFHPPETELPDSDGRGTVQSKRSNRNRRAIAIQVGKTECCTYDGLL